MNRILILLLSSLSLLFYDHAYCYLISSSSSLSSLSLSSSLHQATVVNMNRNISTVVNKRPILPSRVILGYANWNQCDSKLVEAVEQGVNVLVWFACNLIVDDVNGDISITGGPNWDCVAKITKDIREKGLDVIHLLSFGGWNSPHPVTASTPLSDAKIRQVYDYLHYWNREIIAKPDMGFYGFDGFDWDIEGNDTPSSIYNNFTLPCLDFMGRLSQIGIPSLTLLLLSSLTFLSKIRGIYVCYGSSRVLP